MVAGPAGAGNAEAASGLGQGYGDGHDQRDDFDRNGNRTRSRGSRRNTIGPTKPQRPGAAPGQDGLKPQQKTYSGPKGLRSLNPKARGAFDPTGIAAEEEAEKQRQKALESVFAPGDPRKGKVPVDVDPVTGEKTVTTLSGVKTKFQERGTWNSLEEAPQKFKDLNSTLAGDPVAMQEAWNREVRQANGYGPHGALNNGTGAGADATQKAELRDALKNAPQYARELANKFASANNSKTFGGVARNAAHFIGSKAIRGLNSIPSLDLEDGPNFGGYGEFQDFNPVEQGAGFASKGNGLVGALSSAAGLASFAGISPYGSGVQSFRGIDEILDATMDAQKTPGSGFSGPTGGPVRKPKSIYESAAQTLYPQEEEQQTLFGVGVSAGTSAVRSAPNLSNLNLRRAIYRRV